MHRNISASLVSIAYVNKRIGSLIVATATLLAVCGTALKSYAQDQPLGLADVKLLTKKGVSDEVIISQIRNSHTVYHLTAAEILDLKDAGVSEKVIDYMINTPSTSPGGPVVTTAPVAAPIPASAPPPATAPVVVAEAGSAPPPPVVETVVVSPGPGYVWVAGYWRWHERHWAWVPGAWAFPPYHSAVWVPGHWERHWGRPVWVEAHWR